eukprot:gene5352-6023_t
MAESTTMKRQTFSQDTKPLMDWVFYLDLQNNGNIKSLRRKIEHFGGKVEEFLSKDVSCVITNKDIQGTEPLRRSPRNKISNAQLNKPMTRAQGILAKAKHKQKSGRDKTTNVVAIAKGLGIKVKQIDDVMNWLKRKEMEIGRGAVDNEQRVLRSQVNGNQNNSNTRQLKSPFIKIEDQSRSYKPLFQELNQWPTIHFDSLAPDCPFEPAQSGAPRQGQRHGTSSTSGSKGAQQLKGQHTAKATGHNGSSQRAGYCEVCKANYRGLKRHLRGMKHKENASNSEAYKELDDTVRRGRTLAEFLGQLENTKARPPQMNTPAKRTSTDGPVGAAQQQQQHSPSKHQVTPLKIIFSPRAGYSVVKHETTEKITNQHNHATEEHHDDRVIVTKMLPRRRSFDDYSVVWMSELTMKVKRSARILRETGRGHGGSAYVEFPVFKEQSRSDATMSFTGSGGASSSEDSAVIKKYGEMHGKLRLSTRVLNNKNHRGLEEFECPMYVESSEQ